MASRLVKLLLLAALGLAGPAFAQTAYPLFQPSNGIMKGDTSTYVTTSATGTDVTALFGGTCDLNAWLRGDATCQSIGALTRTNDTNVTLTLGGTPASSLLAPTSLTLGWTGTLAAARGGTGLSTVTDDTTLIANGTTWVSTAVPNCTDTTGQHLNYLTASNSFTCGTTGVGGITGLANPTASLGLTAINGSATTAMRSDAAPALNVTIAPTWSGIHTYSSIANTGGIIASSVAPYMSWEETDQGVDAKRWRVGPIASTWSVQTLDDAFSAAATGFQIARSGNTISGLTFGNGTSNPPYVFAGTGLTTFNGVALESNVNPEYRFVETDQAANETTWRSRVNGKNYVLESDVDALGSGRTVFGATRGTAQAITALNFGNGTDNPTYTFAGTGAGSASGLWTFSGTTGGAGSAVNIASTQPTVLFNETDQGATNQLWFQQAQGLHWLFGTVDNPVTTSRNAIDILRSGNAVSSLTFGNASDAPTYSFAGTGATTHVGPILATRSGLASLTDSTLVLNASQPNLMINESAAAANNRLWREVASGSSLLFQTMDDALATQRNFFQVTRSGAAVSAINFGNATDNNSFAFLGSGSTTHTGRILQSGDVGSNTSLDLQNTSAADGRTVIGFTNNRTTSRQWSLGIDTNGGVTKAFEIRDVTGGTIPFSISTGGVATVTGALAVSATNSGTAYGSGEGFGRINNSSATGWGGLSLQRQGTDVVELLETGGSTSTGRFQLGVRSGGTFRNQIDMLPTAWTFGNTTDNPTYGFTGSGATTFSGNVVVTGSSSPGLRSAQQEVRLNNDSGFYSVYNTANSTRSGYFQATSAGTVTLSNDISAGTMDLSVQTGSGTINLRPNANAVQATVTGSGLLMAGATGGAQGTGTVNATQLYVNGTTVCQSNGTNCSASAGTSFVGLTTASSTRTSTVTPSCDATVSLPNATARYSFKADLVFAGGGVTANGWRVNIGTGGGTIVLRWMGVATTNTTTANTAPTSNGSTIVGDFTALFNAAGVDTFVTLTGTASVTSPTAPTLCINWAQNTSNATATTLVAGASIVATRLN